LDQGRFQNITVTYKVGMFDDSETDFATKVSNFRNWLCSKVGYVRLSDEYNPDEYRMAVYSGGLELDHDFLIAGEAEITFDCKPQRWLTSGETATAVANNGTLSNPTLFDSFPLLEVSGYGNISFNGYEIEVVNEPVGDVPITSGSGSVGTYKIMLPDVPIMENDTISISGAKTHFTFQYMSYNTWYFSSVSVQTYSGDASQSPTVSVSHSSMGSGKYRSVFEIDFEFTDPLSFSFGTSATKSIDATIKISCSNGTTITRSINANIQYDGEKTITFDSTTKNISNFVTYYTLCRSDDSTVYSTAISYGQPTYIDCDLGEAYCIEGGIINSLNTYIAFGSDLPKLAPSTNTFTYDNTITSFKVTPRWWKV